MTIDLNASTAERAGLKIHATEDGAYTYVAFDDQIGRVVIDRQAAAQGDRGYRTAPLSAEDWLPANSSCACLWIAAAWKCM